MHSEWNDRKILIAFLAWRGWLFLIAAVSLALIAIYAPDVPRQYLNNATPSPLTIWTRMDSATYLGIAQEGYHAKGHYAGFFPLYPLLIRWLAIPLGGNVVLSSLVISHVALFFSLLYLYRLVRLDFGEKIAQRSIVYLLLFPTSIFLVSAYTEALFLCLSILSFYFARTGRWGRCGVFGFFAALTRFSGILLFLPFLYEYLAQKDFQLKRLRADLFLLLLIPAGIASFFYFLLREFHSFTKYFEMQEVFYTRNWTFTAPIESVREMIVALTRSVVAQNQYVLAAELVIFVVFFVLIFFVFRTQPRSYALYALLGILVPFFSGNVVGIYRYVLVLFPFFILFADWSRKSRPMAWSLGLVFGAFLILVVGIFVSGLPLVVKEV